MTRTGRVRWLMGWGMLWALAALAMLPAFAPVRVNLDLTHRDNASWLATGWDIRFVPDRPEIMQVFDHGQLATVFVELPHRAAYLLRVKVKYHARDQAMDLLLNGTRLRTLRPHGPPQVSRFLIPVPADLTRAGPNELAFQHHGTPGQTEYEAIQATNYRTRLTQSPDLYVALNPSSWWQGVTWPYARQVALQVVSLMLLVALLEWIRVTITPWRRLSPAWLMVPLGIVGLLAIGVVGLAMVSPYRMACDRNLWWDGSAALILASAAIPTMWHLRRVPGITIRHTFKLIRLLITMSRRVRFPRVVRAIQTVTPWLNRATVPILLTSIVVYGWLLRYLGHLATLDKAWNFLGTSGDQMLMYNAAAHVMDTGTFMQPDGTYARITGLAAYLLTTLAVALGGLSPGFGWLRLIFLTIGAGVPLVGFFVVRRATKSAITGLGVALLLAMEPVLVTESTTLYHDVPATVCAGISLYWLSRVLQEEQFRPRVAAILGVTSGLTVLAKMSHLCLLGVMTGAAALRRWTRPRWQNMGVALLTTMLVLGVWMARNARVMGAPILSSQSGLSFAIGTGQNVVHPSGTSGEIATSAQERRFNDLYMAQALTWIRQHPRAYARHIGHQFLVFWMKGPTPWWQPLLWGAAASLGVMLLWERSLIPAMLPMLLYLIFYTATFSIVWPAIPTYYPPFIFLLILMLAPLIAGTVGRLGRSAGRLASSLGWFPSILPCVGFFACVALGVGPFSRVLNAVDRAHRQMAEEHAYLTWVGSVLPPEAVIIKVDLGNPWDAQRATQRPVVFNILNGLPWFVWTTPYGVHEYRRDYEQIHMNSAAFRYDVLRDHGPVDAAFRFTSVDQELFRRTGEFHQILSRWRDRGRQLFVLDTDAKALAYTFLPLNGYVLRGDELMVKFVQACRTMPHRALYRLLPHEDLWRVPWGPGAEETVLWLTAPYPTPTTSTVIFTGAFGGHSGLGKLLVNGRYALSFPVGPSGSFMRSENGYRLAYTQEYPYEHATGGRKFSMGTFALTVPSSVITSGQPLILGASPLMVTGDPESWFGVLDHGNSGFSIVEHAAHRLRITSPETREAATLWIARSQPETSS